jgi:hypothetical protein
MTPKDYLDAAKTFGATMREWIGEGLQPDPLAQDRADICTGRLSGKPCPYNYLGRWMLPEAVAGTIKKLVEVKTHLKLEVDGEDKLGFCEICNCKLSLKVHVPLNVILNNPPSGDFPPWCWVKKEQQQ